MSPNSAVPKILECTLRDGSYAINFRFTKEDTARLVKALDAVGFDLIEVGHGIGLGAYRNKECAAAETDDAYMRASSEAVTYAKWGMFCIPGVAEIDDIDKGADFGMGFIRVGTNVESYRKSQPFIERAKRHGMLVCANFMKSYCCSPEEFAVYALESEKYGSDIVYIVDSAGGMLPGELEHYVAAVRARSDTIRLGFHGHNNLGMGVANALRAMELGVEVVDTSLQGLGRSAGNTPTEQFLCVLLRQGIDLGIDPIAVMDIGEQFVRPLLAKPGFSSIDVVAGYALFHTSYMHTLQEYAERYQIDLRRLIIAVCAHDKAEAPRALVEAEAKRLQGIALSRGEILDKDYYGQEQEASWIQ